MVLGGSFLKLGLLGLGIKNMSRSSRIMIFTYCYEFFTGPFWTRMNSFLRKLNSSAYPVHKRNIIHGSTIHGVFMNHEPVTPPMLGSILCPSWHLQACHLVFSLSLSCHFLFPTTCTHSYALGTTCTQSYVWFLLVKRLFWSPTHLLVFFPVQALLLKTIHYSFFW